MINITYFLSFNIIFVMRTYIVVAKLRCPSDMSALQSHRSDHCFQRISSCRHAERSFSQLWSDSVRPCHERAEHH
ncbi:hypothetical protein DXG20_20385 [Salmonella enterica]|nr:hypothetical protein [Salmonella enterica]